MFSYIKDNLARVKQECALRAARAGVPLPTLVAVTKSASDDEVRYLVEQCGQAVIAENRTSLFNQRYELFDASHRPQMHLIGQLQTNKVKTVIGKTALIQSLDSDRLAAEIEKRAAAAGVCVRVLMEINSGEEANKGGLMPSCAEEFAKALPAYPHLTLAGLMTMAPICAHEEEYRPYFRLTRGIFDRLRQGGILQEDAVLSMGMSESFGVAVEEGATMVRVGRSLFKPQSN